MHSNIFENCTTKSSIFDNIIVMDNNDLLLNIELIRTDKQGKINDLKLRSQK